jgi:hypothetical protein
LKRNFAEGTEAETINVFLKKLGLVVNKEN